MRFSGHSNLLPVVPLIAVLSSINYLYSRPIEFYMPKVGKYKYPGDLDPEAAEEWMDILVNGFGGSAQDQESFAKEVGHSTSESGSFNRKVADARKYGLMTPRGTLEATDLGQRLANPRSEQERQEIFAEMLQNIDILGAIYEDLDGGTEEQFWRVINRLTTANPKEAREAATDLEPMYNRLREAKQETEAVEEPEPQEEKPESNSGEWHKVPEAALYVKVDGDELKFSELTETKIELVRTFLKEKKEQLAEEDDDEGHVQDKLT